jgi:hypothetical protein
LPEFAELRLSGKRVQPFVFPKKISQLIVICTTN